MAKCYGGPQHGRVFESAAALDRIEFYMAPAFNVNTMILDNLAVEPPRIETSTYYRRRYHEQRYEPRRYRELDIWRWENGELFEHEKWEIDRDCGDQPWQFPKVSFLYDFDEWWLQMEYVASKALGIRRHYCYGRILG